MFCCTLLYAHSSIAIILMGKRELVALLSVSSWCLVMVERLFLAVPWCCLRFVIVVFPDHTHYFLIGIFWYNNNNKTFFDEHPGRPHRLLMFIVQLLIATYRVGNNDLRQRKPNFLFKICCSQYKLIFEILTITCSWMIKLVLEFSHDEV